MTVMRLDESRRHHFAEAVEASVAVNSRQQFFVWTQSSVQGLVPHQILICGVRGHGGPALALQHFSASRYFRQPQFDAVCDPVHGLVPRLSAATQHGAEVVVSPSGDTSAAHKALHDLVADNELQNLVARPVMGAHGELAALYAFSRVAMALDAGLRHAVEVLVPHLHHTFVRVLHNERDQQQACAARGTRDPRDPRDTPVVTPRQQEILLLIKDGKTNFEIAGVLDCSPWTVKNHIQNILRRLGTSSRAHAISRAMSLGILRPD